MSNSTPSPTTMSSATTTNATTTATLGLDGSAGTAQNSEGMSLETFLSSLVVAACVFGAEVLLFVLLRTRLQRVYEPRTYLVPEKRRTKRPNPGFLAWFKPIFATANSDFINKSGLDAYFFLRYLLMLLKIFIVLAIAILPILLPLNGIGGRGAPVVRGLDQIAWTNVAPEDTSRYWAHLLLALLVIVLFCYMFYRELRAYIRLRQAYLTSPQHRLRASATTVLVASIPRKWLSVKELLGLYDVFPGGIRNIWINRDFEELSEKVKERDRLARILEKAETALIKTAKKKQLKKLRAEAKKNPEAKAAVIDAENSNEAIANGPGLSSGNPHQIPEDIRDASPENKHRRSKSRFGKMNPIPVVGDGLQKFGSNFIGGVTSGVNRIRGGVEDVIDDVMPKAAYGYQADEGDYQEPLKEKRPLLNERGSSRSAKRGSTLVGREEVEEVEGPPNRRTRPQDIDVSSSSRANLHPMGSHQEEVDDSSKLAFWKKPHKTSDAHKHGDEDETPLSSLSPTSPRETSIELDEKPGKKGRKEKNKTKTEYPKAYNEEYDNDMPGEPVWRKYLKESDRETMRLPPFGLTWMPALPLIGQKVDTIYYCRREVARLNVEIEKDQQEPEKYPLMNSAFIQFNHQVAAHMACQSLSHHVPQMMCPRHIEVNPDDVIWDNMKISWWQRYLRIFVITCAVGGLIIGWAFPVAVVGLVSQIDYLTEVVTWLSWINDLPNSVVGLIQGILPPVGLAILMALLPIILRAFARLQGLHTGMAIERAVQGMYFAFLFIQIFLVVSISSGITVVVDELLNSPFSAPSILAQNLPKASNFFFSYMLLQAFTVSGGAILQIATLFIQFVLSPIMDTTAREKFTRATTLIEIKYGTFFPVYTNLACIGIVYSVISPLILLFNICTFSLFWMVYRYNMLYVNNFRFDTGGLLFPRAINQLFTGIYVMEVCLVGLFFLVRDAQGEVACFPQAIIMIIVTIFTMLYQYTLNSAFGPLLTYLPITLEDDAVLRDEEFAKKNDERRRLTHIVPEEEEGDDLNEVLEARERREAARDRQAEDIEMKEIEQRKGRRHRGRSKPSNPTDTVDHTGKIEVDRHPKSHEFGKDVEAQTERRTTAKSQIDQRPELALFSNIADEIEDLSPEERDMLVARAFQHEALRAKRPVIWIPRDDLGISDDEIRRTQRFSNNIWISNEYTGFDAKGRVVYKRPPPDFDQRDLVEL